MIKIINFERFEKCKLTPSYLKFTSPKPDTSFSSNGYVSDDGYDDEEKSETQRNYEKIKRLIEAYKKKEIVFNETVKSIESITSTRERINTFFIGYEIAGQLNFLNAKIKSKLEKYQSGFTFPNHLLCPISLNLFEDPVTISSGITYERTSIKKSLETSDKCPVTRIPIHVQLYNATLVKYLAGIERDKYPIMNIKFNAKYIKFNLLCFLRSDVNFTIINDNLEKRIAEQRNAIFEKVGQNNCFHEANYSEIVSLKKEYFEREVKLNRIIKLTDSAIEDKRMSGIDLLIIMEENQTLLSDKIFCLYAIYSNSIQIPEHLKCPITCQLLKDPVTIKTGINFERIYIKGYLKVKLTEGQVLCPVTSKNLEIKSNDDIKNLIAPTTQKEFEELQAIKTKYPIFNLDLSKIRKSQISFFCMVGRFFDGGLTNLNVDERIE